MYVGFSNFFEAQVLFPSGTFSISKDFLVYSQALLKIISSLYLFLPGLKISKKNIFFKKKLLL
jgi:hypothetical protein